MLCSLRSTTSLRGLGVFWLEITSGLGFFGVWGIDYRDGSALGSEVDISLEESAVTKPFAVFGLGSPLKPNGRKKGTLTMKGLLENLVNHIESISITRVNTREFAGGM